MRSGQLEARDRMAGLITGMNETVLKLGIFAGVFVVLALLEWLWPRRQLRLAKARRWSTNLAIVAIDSLIVRAMAAFAVPIAAVAAAAYASEHHIGLFHWLALAPWLTVLLAIVVLDFAIWLQHVASHKIPMLWRVHQMHHADVDIDVTTAIRFHPIEIALSMLWKIGWVLALGAPLAAVVTFEIIMNAGAMFSHANIALPASLDQWLRRIIVTPDMHRVHHSVLQPEHDSNYGFNLSIWDRWFGTYTPQPAQGHQGMTIGLAHHQSPDPARLVWSLSLPFKPGSGANRAP